MIQYVITSLNRLFSQAWSWAKKHYHEMMQYRARQYAFRILEAHRNFRSGETVFIVQFVGKSTCIKLNALDLAQDDDLIQGFSPSDVKQIMHAALLKPTLTVIPGGRQSEPYRIISKNFNRKKTKITYVVEQIQNNKKNTKKFDLDDFTASKETLLKFSKQDIYEIAYTAGANSMRTAQDDIEQSKN